jgi:hypothetical protein
MSDGDVELILWGQIAVAVLLAGAIWFLPGVYGPLEYMEAHFKLAPWFSGTATSLGVVVALLNAQFKERSDNQRAEMASKRAAKATAEAACSIANTVHMNNAIVVDMMCEDDWETCVDALRVIVESLGISRDAMRRFPMHNLRMKALEKWYRVELFQHYVVSDIEAIREVASRVPTDLGLLRAKRSVLKSSQNLDEALLNLADGLGVSVAWDYGTMEPFEVSAVAAAEIEKTSEQIKANGG